MDIYNTAVMVVANLEAEDERAAIGALAGSLTAHGFAPITDVGEPIAYASAYVADDDTEAETLPEPGMRPARPAAASLGPLASRFTVDELEALIITAGDLWVSTDTTDNLSYRQKRLAERVWNLMNERMESTR